MRNNGKLLSRLRSILFLYPAWFLPHARMRTACHRLRGVRVGKNVEIGYFVIIANVNPSAVEIQDGVTIAARATILEHDNAFAYSNGMDSKEAGVVIEERAFIGVHSVVMPGVCIGRGAIVGGQSLVTKNVPAGEVWGGVPSKRLGVISEDQD